MSLAILPPASMATTFLPPSSASLKRPKLSLNTTSVPSISGKGATSLRLETLSATSPTVRNTFRNAYPPIRGGLTAAPPQKPKLNLMVTNVPSTNTRTPTPLSTDLPNITEPIEVLNPSPTATSASTIDSCTTTSAPYKLAYNTTSILKNGPLPRNQYRARSSAPAPMFPAAKKVAFRATLTEDVQTVKYTMKHSDIESSTSTISTLELSPPGGQTSVEDDGKENEEEKVDRDDKDASSPQAGDKRESSDEEDSDVCPATPVAGRRKRNRLWRWTLPPADSAIEQKGLDEGDHSAHMKVEHPQAEL